MQKSPVEDANFLSKFVFWWISPLLRKGFTKKLELSDVYKVPSFDLADTLSERLERFLGRSCCRQMLRRICCCNRAWSQPSLEAGAEASSRNPGETRESREAVVQPSGRDEEALAQPFETETEARRRRLRRDGAGSEQEECAVPNSVIKEEVHAGASGLLWGRGDGLWHSRPVPGREMASLEPQNGHRCLLSSAA
ncbi:hypothetical protein GOODEAATRI_028165 [Goodea atripinnis]|uniref:Uncharacterized protein n=1 Tax=Goodea atripinnis TaxID=208336 RepID=A0ABV0N4X0_9TELE